MLDGLTSMDRIKDQFERQFAPQKITFQDLQQFIGMLHRSGLVISEAPGQGQQLKRRRDEKKRKELLGKFANVFALRFRGFDPEWLLNWLIRYTGWFFSPAAMVLVVMLGAAAATLVAVQFDIFRSRLSTFHEFFGPDNWLYLGITMGPVKVLHEFGHGLSCKRYGGECHEIGVMFLVFTPWLYCNVSDSWMLPNKWQRAFIGAAVSAGGMPRITMRAADQSVFCLARQSRFFDARKSRTGVTGNGKKPLSTYTGAAVMGTSGFAAPEKRKNRVEHKGYAA